MTPTNFIRERIDRDLETKKYAGRVVTRFPPEPNGYLHIGHAKSICLNFGLARDYQGRCHLRMDDTNPTTEDMEYVEAIERDIQWLGFQWQDMYYASDYYQQLYDIAVRFVKEGKAYVDDLSEEEISAYRGSVREPGKPSPHRARPVAENLDLLERMRKGEFAEGSRVLRAKADLASPNMKMRDPLMYRIKKSPHYRTKNAWAIYPFYDFAHCFSDSFERITHSICTLEFENNRELYDWYLKQMAVEQAPEQIEFARLSLDYTVMSKRKLLALVKDKHVSGWDDPRMPTLAGMRRRGYTPEAIRRFCDMIGVAKSNSVVDIGKLEFAVREDLNERSPRILCVLQPLEVVIENYPEAKSEELDAPYFPKDSTFAQTSGKAASRKVPFSRTVYIERDDFMETPSKDFYRLAPGREVRLRFGYVIKCERVVKDESGAVKQLVCTYDDKSAGGHTSDGRKVKGIIHWVSAAHAKDVEVRLYDRLFSHPAPDATDEHFSKFLNPTSLALVPHAKIEPAAAAAGAGEHFQFERQGFFFVDPVDSKAGAPVFNRTVSLKDSWTKASETEVKAEARVEKPKAAPKAAPGERPAERSLTAAQRTRAEGYAQKLGVPADEAEILAADDALAAFFEAAEATCKAPKALASWMVNELLRELKVRPLAELPFDAKALGALVALMESGAVSRRAAKDVFAKMLASGGEPGAIMKKMGLEQVSDTAALEAMVSKVIAAHAEQVTRYKGGESKLFGFFVGQVMKASGGKANPQVINTLLQKALG